MKCRKEINFPNKQIMLRQNNEPLIKCKIKRNKYKDNSPIREQGRI